MKTLYFLVEKGGFSKKRLIDLAAKKDPGFDIYWLGVALERIRSFDQKAVDMLLLVEKIDFSTMRDFFCGWLKELAGSIKSHDEIKIMPTCNIVNSKT